MMSDATPMMRQYLQMKEQYKDCILFYRLGDFYEMFFDDAIIISKELELTLTGKDCGQKLRAGGTRPDVRCSVSFRGRLSEQAGRKRV